MTEVYHYSDMTLFVEEKPKLSDTRHEFYCRIFSGMGEIGWFASMAEQMRQSPTRMLPLLHWELAE